MSEGSVYHSHYSGFSGVDLCTALACSRSYLADAENMWRDPLSPDSEALESFPGYRMLTSFGAPIYGIFHQRVGKKSYAVVHAGTHLYRFDVSLRHRPRELAALSPLPITVKEEKGCGFAHGEALYLLIGGTYLCITANGEIKTPSESAYLPTTYLNAEPYEQRNLLVDETWHRFTADGDYLYEEAAEEALRFEVYSEGEKTCAVYASPLFREAAYVRVPASAIINGESYTVTAVKPNAFANMRTLVSITLPPTVTILGADAFAGCTALLFFDVPDTVEAIGHRCFLGCLSLSELYLGESTARIGEKAFSLCPALETVRYGGTQASFEDILLEDGESIPPSATVLYEASPTEHYPALFRYPLAERILSVGEVLLDDFVVGEDHTLYKDGFLRYRTVVEDGVVSYVDLIASDRRLLSGRMVSVRCLAAPFHFEGVNGRLTGADAISGCRLAADYDGRIFLSGTEALPFTVFHTLPGADGMNDPFYVGTLSYFNDAVGTGSVLALLGTGSMLAVFKGEEDADGAILYHTAESTASQLVPRIYPTYSGASGVGVRGGATVFRNDAVFLSPLGLLGIERESLSAERRIVSRSYRVDARLRRENLKEASLTVHEGLLYLLTDGRIYLADGRRLSYRYEGEESYEWYLLSGIGSFTGDAPLYRRSAYLPKGAEAHGVIAAPAEGEAATGRIFSLRLETGEMLYYERAEDGKQYAVDCDGERTGGVFCPATVIASVGEVLLFGTKDGSILAMNTDKRGKRLYRLSAPKLYYEEGGTLMPLSLADSLPVSEEMLTRKTLYEMTEEGARAVGEADVYQNGATVALAEPYGEETRAGEVHRYYYTFAGHPYTAACTLSPDDGGLPHFSKDTLPLSAAVRVKTARGGAFTVLVRTDRTPWTECEQLTGGSFDFGALDFSRLDFHSEESVTLPLRERERRWCYKQYRFASHGVRSPFGLYSLSYAFRRSGPVKV